MDLLSRSSSLVKCAALVDEAAATRAKPEPSAVAENNRISSLKQRRLLLLIFPWRRGAEWLMSPLPSPSARRGSGGERYAPLPMPQRSRPYAPACMGNLLTPRYRASMPRVALSDSPIRRARVIPDAPAQSTSWRSLAPPPLPGRVLPTALVKVGSRLRLTILAAMSAAWHLGRHLL